MKSPASVLLVCGSPNDLELVLDCEDALAELGIGSQVRVLSAHRTPDETAEAAKNAEKEGFRAIIAFAGMSAALAGVAAAHTLLPVIGVPVQAARSRASTPRSRPCRCRRARRSPPSP